MPPPEARKELVWEEEEEEEGILGHFSEKKWQNLILPRPPTGPLCPVLASLVLITIEAEPRLPVPGTRCLLRALLCSAPKGGLSFGSAEALLGLCPPEGGVSVGHCHAGFSRVVLCGVLG